LAPGEVQPVWVTVHVPAGTPAGIYRGTLSISTEAGGRKEIPVRLRVWSFDLPPVPSLKTLTWVGGLPDDTGFQNGRPLSYQKKLAMYDLLLSHRLGPGGNLELIDEEIGYCRERGMNVFLLAVIPNLKRTHQEDYSTEYKEQLARKLKSAVEKFGPRGWLESMAYVYNYDEVDREHWPLARQMYGLVKSVSSELKVIQCLNIPEGVRAMAGFADTWDVYIAQYEKTGVEERVAQGDEAWLAVCCYPVDRPNFFLEYPAIDGRLIGWICWRTGVSGFEYWSPNHWGENRESPQLRSNWIANTFLDYNGDGYLTYPGPEGSFLSSVRLENLRDGFEDYEYLKLLERLGGDPQAAGLVAASTTEFTSDPELLSRVREEIAVQIEKLSGSDKVR
ncbi:MAG TPA: glycoside hydrolase domain-containing protein, partial [Candidatus Glassbacteria bacterium]|nr:glycoside hydrolase domain-containing protein [Candidatus Glassbacteria bacterium]